MQEGSNGISILVQAQETCMFTFTHWSSTQKYEKNMPQMASVSQEKDESKVE